MRYSPLALPALLAFVGFSAAPNKPVREATLRIVVNIPAFRLDAYVGDSLVRTLPIAVGMPSFKSPRGDFTITSIEWNPWWNPPASPWAAKEKRTPPGRGNPMGRVKINFRALYFLHGTPLDASIGSAASHGCIRLHNADAIALAKLVHHYGSPRLSEADVERLAADTATRRIDLELPVAITLRYDRVEVRNDSVFVYRDVYGLTTRSATREIMDVLGARGIDTMTVDSARVRVLTRRVPPRGNAAALSDFGAPISRDSTP